jgi:hypothetical protein
MPLAGMPPGPPAAFGFFKSVDVIGSPSTLATTLSISSARTTRAFVAICSVSSAAAPTASIAPRIFSDGLFIVV